MGPRMESAAFSSGNFTFAGGSGEKFVAGKRLDHVEFDSSKPVDEDFLFSKYQQQEHCQQIPVYDHGLLDDLMFDPVGSQLAETCFKKAADVGDHGTENVEHTKEKNPISMASLGLLRSYGNGIRKLDGDRIIEPRSDRESNNSADERLSIEGIVRLAGAKFIQASSSTMDLLSVLGPFGLAFSGLSDEEKQEVQLVELLLVCAEKLNYHQFDRARNLLNRSSYLFSNHGTPVQRLVHYFADALHERIDRLTGRVTSDDFWKTIELNRDVSIMNPHRSRIACHMEIPFCQVAQFTGIQSIVENVPGAKRVHVIDLSIGTGTQWAILMQALQNSGLELLKVTAIGTHMEHVIENTGKRLESFARTMNFSFTFRLVMVDDLLHLEDDNFKVDSEETVVVYSQYYLRTLITKSDRLDALMKVIVRISPSLMVVTEVDANHNSPSFVNRFIEALFFYGAYFDCLETYMERMDENRLALESFYFGEGIRNIVATEGDERTIRSVTIDVWRAFFARFRMVEVELSPLNMYQASLVTKRFKCGKFCTLDKNGKCLIIGWKDTPMVSLSVWKFN